MKSPDETIQMKRWHAYPMLGLAGFALGTIVAKVATALGF